MNDLKETIEEQRIIFIIGMNITMKIDRITMYSTPGGIEPSSSLIVKVVTLHSEIRERDDISGSTTERVRINTPLYALMHTSSRNVT
jgi:hypothetical protein